MGLAARACYDDRMTFEDMFRQAQTTAIYKHGANACTMQQIMMEMFRIMNNRIMALEESSDDTADDRLPDMRCGE